VLFGVILGSSAPAINCVFSPTCEVTVTDLSSPAQGGAPGKGDSSYFFGLVSAKPKKTVSVSAANTLGPPLSLNAWVPQQ
jgi:hypothetical protein